MIMQSLSVNCAIIAMLAAAPLSAQTVSDEDALLEAVNRPWKGDLDGMIERGFIRVLTAYNPLFFSYDGIEQRGIAVEVSRIFEQRINAKFGSKRRPINVVLIPVARDKLLPYLLDGRGDIAGANLTITSKRLKQVGFSDPTYPNISELVVSGSAAPEIRTLDDLVEIGLVLRRPIGFRANTQPTSSAHPPGSATPAGT